MIESNYSLPHKMTLKIDAIGFSKKVRVVWQDETIAGLAFDEKNDAVKQIPTEIR